jgi:phosphoribosylformimino-5-aminoimidazole carboxamide ribotide isomerase
MGRECSGASDDEPVTNFVSEKSPGDFARMYQTDGLTGGHVIMLSADDDTKEAAFEALRAYPGGLQVRALQSVLL